MEVSESRRKFLKNLSSGLMLPLIPSAFHLTSKNQIISDLGTIQSWTTCDDKRFAQSAPISWRPYAPGDRWDIAIRPQQQYQEILGFGAAFTDAACYTFNRMPEDKRASLMQEMFAAQEMNLSMCRTCIGASDYSTHAYTYDEGEADPDLKRFSIKQDQEYILPVLRQARKINPDLFLFSTPWTPPGWMKSNKSMLGGNMQRKSMAAYAKYFGKFLRAYADDGVPIQAVTVQNEVDTD
jgi:glucosylceramidase